jgi:hydroxyacylglutathione hydrolase
MYLQQFFIDGHGCASYLVGCEAKGIAAVVDPDREVKKYIQAAESRGLKITHIIETHLHADHVSGNTDLAQRTGADIYLHESAGVEFPHQPLQDGQILKLGNLNLRVQHTPGHTPESITLLVSDTTRSQQPWLALTGDTLFVGDAGRPDLVGVEAARDLAAQLHESLFQKLAPMNDSLMIYPGHGAGSLCGKSIGSMRSTTLGYERSTNPALTPRKKAEFVEYATTNLPEQPGNHKRIKSINRQGPAPLGEVKSKPLSIEDSIPHFRRGAAMLDTRPKQAFVEKHVPGAVHLEADDQLSNKIGFVLPPELPIVLVVENEEVYRQVVYSLARVGYEAEVVGYLSDSLDEWEAKGLPVTSGDIEDISIDQLDEMLKNTNGSKPVVIDVREPWEFQQGHIPGAILIPLGSLSSQVDQLDHQHPVAVVCATGNRSVSAAALLGQKKFEKIYNVLGGTMAWMQQGLPLEN